MRKHITKADEVLPAPFSTSIVTGLQLVYLRTLLHFYHKYIYLLCFECFLLLETELYCIPMLPILVHVTKFYFFLILCGILLYEYTTVHFPFCYC